MNVDAIFDQIESKRKDGKVISEAQIDEFFNTQKPKENTALETGARSVAQLGLGALESTPVGLVYDASVAPLASQDAQNIAYGENFLGPELERITDAISMGVADEQDYEILESIKEQIKDKSKSNEYAQTMDVSLQGLAEKISGVDLNPKNEFEQISRLTGIVRNPSRIIKGKAGKELVKSILPTFTEVAKGTGMTAGLEIAKSGGFGPIGEIGAMVIGDLVGSGVSGLAKKGVKSLAKPSQSLANLIAKGSTMFKKPEQVEVMKDVVKSFKEQGLQLDLGTLTDNNLIKWIQSRISQSSILGSKNASEFKKNLVEQIKNSYENIANGLGISAYENRRDAGEVLRNELQEVQETARNQRRSFYNDAFSEINSTSTAEARNTFKDAKSLLESLKPGSLKSPGQKTVIGNVKDILRDIRKDGYVKVESLMNNYLALKDIIDYEKVGGSKSLLKKLTKSIEKDIKRYGHNINPMFSKKWFNAQKEFKNYMDNIQNKSLTKLVKNQDPSQIFQKMKSPQGFIELEKAFKMGGKEEVFNKLKRHLVDDIVGNHMVDNVTNQLKTGKFKNIMSNPQNREVLKRSLGKESFGRLDKLVKNASKLQDSANKFYNASQSATVAGDFIAMAKLLKDFGHLAYGNPFPAAKSALIYGGAKTASNMIFDPEFLKLVEDALVSTGKKSSKSQKLEMAKVIERARPYLESYKSTQEN